MISGKCGNYLDCVALNSRCRGEIYQWEFYARRAGIFYGAVWREVAPQLIQLRGRNTIHASGSGTQVIKLYM